MHLIDPERFAAVVDGPSAGTIGVRQRIALGQEIPFLIQRTKRFIPDFMIEQHELAEIRSGGVVDIHLPPAVDFGRRASFSERVHIFGAPGFHDERSEKTQDRQFTIVAVRVKLPHALLHLRMDIPLEFLRLAWGDNGLGIRCRGRSSSTADDHAGGLDK